MSIEERAQEVASVVGGSGYDNGYGYILYALQKERSLAQMEIVVLEAEVDRLRREIERYKLAIEGKI